MYIYRSEIKSHFVNIVGWLYHVELVSYDRFNYFLYKVYRLYLMISLSSAQTAFLMVTTFFEKAFLTVIDNGVYQKIYILINFVVSVSPFAISFIFL